jgi:hypothetical protein
MYSENKSDMQCAEFEALLAEALDGTLAGARRAAFDAHRSVCATCALMLAEAEAGLHWLETLKEEAVEPPALLVHNILRATTGAQVPATAKRKPLWQRLREWPALAPVFSTVLQPRFAMSFAMAFFSISLVLSFSGVNLRDIRHLDLSPNGIASRFAMTQGKVISYYENIKFVYELESRVRELKRATGTETKPENPENKQPEKPKSQKDNQTGEPDREKYRNYSLDEARPLLAAYPGAVRQDKGRLSV